MGYRSNVVFAIEKDVVPLFIAHIASNKAAQSLCFKEADYHTKDYEGKGHWLFRWDHIKWYPSYPAIQAIESFVHEKLQDLPESWASDPEEYYRLVVIGEDTEDIQVYGWGFDGIYVCRSIEH